MAVEFSEEENFNRVYNEKPTQTSGLTNFIIKIGLANNEGGAKVVMIIVAVICFALAIYFATQQ